uniref:Uncharacterized protein n=1 Tax=Oryza rufipogon TaxID=4529 RepID=A0A0E0QVI4_ORYRU
MAPPAYRNTNARKQLKRKRGQRWQRERSVVIPRSSCHCQRVKLRWFCEKSGLILFTADYRCYTLNLETMEVDMVAGFGIQGDVDN